MANFGKILGNLTVPLHFINIRFENSKIESLKTKSNKLLIANFVYPTLISLGLVKIWPILTESWPILTLQHSDKIVQGLVKFVLTLVMIGQGSCKISQDQTYLDRTLTDLDPSTFGQDWSKFGQDRSRFGKIGLGLVKMGRRPPLSAFGIRPALFRPPL